MTSSRRVKPDHLSLLLLSSFSELQTEKGGDPEVVRASQKKRFASETLVDEVLALYKEWTQLEFKLNGLSKDMRLATKAIGEKMKKKENADQEKAQKAELDKQFAELKPKVGEAELEMKKKAGMIGNIVGEKVPISDNEVSC